MRRLSLGFFILAVACCQIRGLTQAHSLRSSSLETPHYLLLNNNSTTSSFTVNPKRGLADSSFYCQIWDAVVPPGTDGKTSPPIPLNEYFSWTYDWGYNRDGCEKMPLTKYVPMIWGKGTLPLAHQQSWPSSEGRPLELLGFNEPNQKRQSGMLPAEVAELWPSIEYQGSRWGVERLGAPVPSYGCAGGSKYCIGPQLPIPWLEEFFGNCSLMHGARGCMVDFMTIHYYGCNTTELEELIHNFTKRFGEDRPIWITEFNCGLDAPISKQLEYMKTVIPMLNSQKHVERFSWFVGSMPHKSNPYAVADLFNVTQGSSAGSTEISLTELGELYLSL